MRAQRLIEQAVSENPLPQLIKRAVTELGMSPREINSGECGKLARLVVRQARQQGVAAKMMTRDNHDFIELDGRYFDAEAPAGVQDWKELPVLKGR
jgi:hypothetical protein